MRRAKKNRIRRIKKAILFSTVMMCFSVAVYSSQIKRVSVDYLGDVVTFKTMAKTVAQAFEEKNIIISEGLVVSKDLNSNLSKENNISIDAPKILAMIEEEKEAQPVVNTNEDIVADKIEEPKTEEVKPEVKEEIKVEKKEAVKPEVTPVKIEKTEPKQEVRNKINEVKRELTENEKKMK